jgi:hypothetical protein
MDNQSMPYVQVLNGLYSLTFGSTSNQLVQEVQLPSCLQRLTVGETVNQCTANVQLPNGSVNLTWQHPQPARAECAVAQRPAELTVGETVNHNRMNTQLPNGPLSLTVGSTSNQLCRRCSCPASGRA